MWIPSLAAPAAALSSAGPALAESGVNMIISESRRKAKEDAKVLSVWNWNSYKTPTQNYNASDLQSYLPTVFLAKRVFEGILVELENPRVKTDDPLTYDALREQNRQEPAKLLRKETFRTKLWLREHTGKYNAGEFEYERLKRALDEEDTQFLQISRTEGQLDAGAIRTAKRNVEAIVDAIDQLLELIPGEELEVARVVSDTKTIPELKLPMVGTGKADASGGNGTDAGAAKDA